jgi:serine/threonine protein kinase
VLARRGRPLAEAIASGAISPDRAADIGRKLAAVLGEGHQVGLHHGCVCPRHVALRDDGEPEVDLLRLAVGEQHTLGPDEMACAAPEQRRGGYVDGAADIYALGVLLATMLDGPGAGRGSEESAALRESELRELVDAMCAHDPTVRPTAGEVVARLEELQLPVGPNAVPRSAPRLARELRSLHGDAEYPAIVGRWSLLRALGRGAMGAVFYAEDPTTGQRAAVKVLHPTRALDHDTVLRFRREARLLGEVRSPRVASLIEVGEDQGRDYLAMEFVDGTPIGKSLKTQAPLTEEQALDLFVDVVRAVADLHTVGIVHRDIKPDNLLLLPGRGEGDPEVKLCDFGLARRVDPSASLEVTRAAALVGTPQYMAPEQCVGDAVDARADVYSLGILLFRLLTGRLPFDAEAAGAIIGMHVRDEPPDLRREEPPISEPVAALVGRALQKDRKERFSDAGSFLDAAEKIRLRQRNRVALRPPAADSEGDPETLIYEVVLDLDSSPEALWPHVANTERLNRAIGLNPVVFSREIVDGRVETSGRFHVAGTEVEWREHPFEWIAPERLGVLREYTKGPLKWMRSTVELQPRAPRGTRLVHRIEVQPIGVLGRTVARFEVGMRARRGLRKVYERIDRALASQVTAAKGNARGPARLPPTDPFEEPASLTRAQNERIDELRGRLIERSVDAVVASRLCDHLASASSQALGRIRPRELARRLSLDEEATVHACLWAAEEGGLVLLWDILCPSCRVASTIAGTLRELRQHGRCEACNIDFDLDLARSVEMVFRAHPEIRQADVGTYCIGGPAHFPHVVAQLKLEPHERLCTTLELTEGSYIVTGRELRESVAFRVQPGSPMAQLRVTLATGIPPRAPRQVATGVQELELVNDTGHACTVRIEKDVARADALTAAEAACLPTFRRLFPGELLSPNQLISVSRTVVVFIEPANVSRLYDSGREDEAVRAVAATHRLVEDQVAHWAGTVVKMHESAVMASFSEPVAAVRAALRIIDEGSGLRAVVHRGSTLATTVNERLDYFGKTVHDATKLLRQGAGTGLVLSDEMTTDPGVTALLQELARGAEVELTGERPLQRIRPAG